MHTITGRRGEMCRLGENHKYIVYRVSACIYVYLWQGNHQIYGHMLRIYIYTHMALANPNNVQIILNNSRLYNATACQKLPMYTYLCAFT